METGCDGSMAGRLDSVEYVGLFKTGGADGEVDKLGSEEADATIGLFGKGILKEVVLRGE